MTRHPTSFRFPDPTIAQLQRLAERFGNRTTAVIVAIDRLYQSERRDEMLIVKGQFPRNAHSRIPEDTPAIQHPQKERDTGGVISSPASHMCGCRSAVTLLPCLLYHIRRRQNRQKRQNRQ